jgi:hypothetical protein
MGIVDFFRPKHRHSNPQVRAEAVRALGADDADVLMQVAQADRDPAVRRLAIERITRPNPAGPGLRARERRLAAPPRR